MKTPFAFDIRSKLFLVLLTLLIIPVIGYKYIQEMEDYLRGDQEKSLLENARLVAAVLQDYPNIFQQTETSANSTEINSSTGKNHLYIRPLKSGIQMDGYAEDWIYYRDRAQTYSSVKFNDTNNVDSSHRLTYRFLIGNYDRYVYALFQVNDQNVIYRKPNKQRLDQSDHLKLVLQDKNGKIRNYVISTHTPGWITAYRIAKSINGKTKLILDDRVKAFWQETPNGYNIELRIPLSLLGKKLTFAVADVDDPQTRNVEILLSTTDDNQMDELSTVSIPTPEVYRLINRLQTSSSRIWVVNTYGNVIVTAGSLLEEQFLELEPEQIIDISFQQVMSGLVRLFYLLVLTQPADEFQDDLSNASRLTGKEIQTALNGEAETTWRQTPDARVNILTATYPIIINGKIHGAVAVEETSNSILILQNKAIEILINLSILAFLVATITLLTFATRLSMRIRRLRDDAEGAIGEDGQVHGTVKNSRSSDEIGDLTRSFSSMLDRLSQYNRYLESMASKLSHELRTPITVVKSSLENLESQKLDEHSHAYTTRAREGVERLNNILTRMSEATRLEQTLQSEQSIIFDVSEVIRSCVNGYQIAKPDYKIELDATSLSQDQALNIKGAPDLIAQLLDKLISNAISFSEPENKIIVHLVEQDSNVRISILNQGPPLPEDMQDSLFDSMVSLRSKKGDEPHLGLGLYIVRLIAEFHQGKVTAKNREDVSGAEFVVSFPLVGDGK